MKLNETVEMMNSDQHKERFKAEYYQLKCRIIGLDNMLNEWREGKLTYSPAFPCSTYELQLRAMYDYKAILEMRAVMENIEIDMTLEKA